jgi:hypothetical protein
MNTGKDIRLPSETCRSDALCDQLTVYKIGV